MIKRLPIIALFFLVVKISNAQFINYPLPSVSSDPTFEEKVNYLKALIPHVNSDNPDGYERAVQRFENYWEVRVNKDGRLSDYTRLLKDFSSNQISSVNSNKYSSGWQNIGPFTSQNHSIGRVMDVWVSPNNSNKILIGTRASGIWKSIDGGANWENITDRSLPTIGIQSIAVSPLNDSIIYATTGFAGSYTNNYGIGIIYSNDGGVNWMVDNPPTGYGDLKRNDLLFVSPLAFKAGSNELFVGLDQKVWKKDASTNGTGWVANFVYTLDQQILDMNQYIHEIDFAPNNSNFGIITPTYRKPEEIVYTSNGGTTWTTIPLPSNYTNNAFIKAYTASVSIPNDNYAYLLISGNDYDANWVGTPRYGSVIKYDITGSQPQIVKEWVLTSPSIVESQLSGFCVQSINSTKEVGFFGKIQDAVFRIDLLSSATIASINAISRTRTEAADNKSHTDIRGLTLVNNILYSASDGGINKLANLETGNKPDWISINGYGLSITEHSGFDISQFDKDLIIGGAIDGNSFKIKGNGNNGKIFENIGSGDQYDVALPKSKDHFDKNISTQNGTPADPPSYVGSGTFGGLASAYTGLQKSVDYSLKQFYFEDITNDFYAGTSDVYKIDNFLGTNRYKTSSEWSPRSNTHENSFVKHATLTTKVGISAFKSIQYNGNTNSVYAIKSYSKSTHPITLIRSIFNPNVSGSPAYNTVDITPYTVIVNGSVTSNSMVYKSYITEIIIDENDPNKIWISFGGTSETSTPTGRVYYSNNAGSTWTDISEGLPHLPVLSMVYWKGTDDIIFAGTDLGVYVYDKLENKWEGFNNDLPYVCVPELAINYCTNKLVACTFGRGFWETPLPNLSYETQVPMEITTNQVWNTSRDTYQSVVVRNGATLTIQGTHNASTNINSVEIRIPKDKQIMVEPGGKLIISGATLTNHCDLWQGIQVYGEKTANQVGEAQGWVVIKDGAIIENARTGVTTSKVYDWGWDQNTTGGIVHCYNSTFRNNRRDIELLSYHRTTTKKTDELPNRSLFSKCVFVTDDNYLFGTQRPVHITMWDVSGASIIGSTFEDARSIPVGSIGIYTISAGFNVNEYCMGSTQVPVSSSPACSGIQSVFKNLEYGIYAMSLSNPKYSVNVSNTIFDKCSRAIYLNGVDYASVFLNTFTVKRPVGMPVNEYNNNRYGVYLDLCKSYKVEQNTFIGDVDAESETKSFGIVVRNMHGENTQVYKNYFNLLTVGIEAIARNKSREQDKGLQIRCNDFNESQYDIVVVNDPEAPSPVDLVGIARNQGYPNSNFPDQLAGNLFGNASSYLVSNFVNNGGFVEYFHHDPGSEPRVEPSSYQSALKIGLINQGNPYSVGTACPTSFTNVFTSSQLRSSVITAGAQLTENIEALNALIDAGNTEDFLNSVDFYDVNQVNTNYFLIMNLAPYLSIDVLKQVVDDGTAFSNAMIRNILVACPHAAKEGEIQSRLDNRSNPLPGYMRDQINVGLVEMSSLEIDQRQIGSYQFMIDNSVSETMWRATQDTLDLSDDIFSIFSEIEDPTHKLQEVQWLDAAKRFDDADALLSQIRGQISSDDERFVNIFDDLRILLANYTTSETDLLNLSSTEISALQNHIEAPEASAAPAYALLKLNNSLEYIEPLVAPEEGSGYRIKNISMKPLSKELDPSESSLDISPNPVSDLFTAKYKILEKSKNLQLIITDINGREVFVQNFKNNIDEIIVNCSQFISGKYIVTIKGDNIKSLSKKIVITKD